MSDETPVDRLYVESSSAIRALSEREPSLAVSAGDNFRKSLLLAATSYFEYRVANCVAEFVHERSSGAALVVAFVKNKAIARQYHTWFSWNDSNANQFFGLFGPDFRQMMIDRVKNSEQLRGSIQALLELGSERNKLVHQDFASYPLEKTLEEIYTLYKSALHFVDGIADHLRECQPVMPTLSP